MESHPVITFPPRPPTHNTLTAEQRAQLMRSSSKLEQILGSTPHVLDFTYTHVESRIERKPRRRLFHRRAKSVPDPEEDSDRADSPVSAVSAPSPSISSETDSVHSEQSWRIPYPSQRPPLLQLPTVARPRFRPTMTPSHREHDDARPDSTHAPNFTIMSEAAMRREKMRRLIKRLGEGVPSRLVFPPEPETDSDEETDVLSTPTSSSCGRDGGLPTIPEVSRARLPMRHEAAKQPPRVSHFVGSTNKSLSRRAAIYVVENPDELTVHGGSFAGIRSGAQC